MQVVALIGGNKRMVREKDMEQKSGLMETDTLGSTCRMPNTAMEYTHGQMERYIKDNGNKIRKKVMHIKDGQMAMSIMDSTRMVRSTEKEYSNKVAYFIQLKLIMTR